VIFALLLRASLASGPLIAHPGGNHPIADAVSRARPGDTVRLQAGVYREPTITIDKPLTLIGEPGAIIDGEHQRALLVVTADDVTIESLVLRNVRAAFVEDPAGIRLVGVRNCLIRGNTIENGFFGIYLSNVTDCRIERNTLRASAKTEAASGNGIHLWSSRRIAIVGNSISGHRDGIYFEFVHDTEVRDNVSEGNLRYGLHFMYSDDCRYLTNVFRRNGAGVAVMYTRRVSMIGNAFDHNWGPATYGLLLKEISDATLRDNRFDGNTTGLLADGATRLTAEHNEFRRNGWAVRLDANTQDADFRRNNFSSNTFDVATNSGNTQALFDGNYWSEYRGYDLDRDGRGDVPFHPVRLFSVLVESNRPALLLLHSAFADLIDAAERAIPSLTPATVVDRSPSIRPVLAGTTAHSALRPAHSRP